MLRSLRSVLVSILLMLAGTSAEAQSMRPHGFLDPPRAGLGLAPLRPMLGLPSSPGLSANTFPGLGHPSLFRPGPPPVVAHHRTLRRPAFVPKHRGTQIKRIPKHRHVLFPHHQRPRIDGRLVRPGLRIEFGDHAGRPILRRLRPVGRGGPIVCTAGACLPKLGEAALADYATFVCVLPTRTGGCARIVRIVRP